MISLVNRSVIQSISHSINRSVCQNFSQSVSQSDSRFVSDLVSDYTYLITYLLTPWCRVLLEKLTGLQLVKKFPAFHGTRRFITALTSVPRMRVFLNKVFYREGLLAPRPTPKLEDHPSSAVRDCLFNLFTATLLIGGRSSIRNLRRCHVVVTGTNYMELMTINQSINQSVNLSINQSITPSISQSLYRN